MLQDVPIFQRTNIAVAARVSTFSPLATETGCPGWLPPNLLEQAVLSRFSFIGNDLYDKHMMHSGATQSEGSARIDSLV